MQIGSILYLAEYGLVEITKIDYKIVQEKTKIGGSWLSPKYKIETFDYLENLFF